MTAPQLATLEPTSNTNCTTEAAAADLSLQLKYFALAQLLSFSPHRLRACVDIVRRHASKNQSKHKRSEEGEDDSVMRRRSSSSTLSFREAPIDGDHPPELLLLALAVVYPYYGYNEECKQDGAAAAATTTTAATTTGCTSRVRAFFERYDSAETEGEEEMARGSGIAVAARPRGGSSGSLERAVAHLAAPTFAQFYTYIEVKPTTHHEATAGANSSGSISSSNKGGSKTPLYVSSELLQRHYQSFWRCLPSIFHVPVPDSSSNHNNTAHDYPSQSPTPTGSFSAPPSSPAATANRQHESARNYNNSNNSNHNNNTNKLTYLQHNKHSRFNDMVKVHALFPSFIPFVLELLLDLCFKNEHEGEEAEGMRSDIGSGTTRHNASTATSINGLAVYTRTARRAFLYLLEIYIPVYAAQCPYLPPYGYRGSVRATTQSTKNNNSSSSKEEEGEVRQTVESIKDRPAAQGEDVMAQLEALQRLRRTFLQKIKMALLRHKYLVATSHNQPTPTPAKSKQQQKAPALEDESSWVLQLSSSLLLSDLLPYLTVCTDHYRNNNNASMDFSFCCQQYSLSETSRQQQHQVESIGGSSGPGSSDVDEEAEKNCFLHFRSLLLEEYVCLLYEAMRRQGSCCRPSSSSTESGGEDEKGEEETIQTLEKLIASLHGSMDFPFLLQYYHKDGKYGSSRKEKSAKDTELREALRRHLRMIKDDHSDFCSINQYFVQSETMHATSPASATALASSSSSSTAATANSSGGSKPSHNNSLFERLTSSIFPSVIVHYITLMECTLLKRKFQRRWQRENEVVSKRIDDDDDDDNNNKQDNNNNKSHSIDSEGDDDDDDESRAEAARFVWSLPSKVPGHVSLHYSSTMSCLTFFQLPVNSNVRDHSRRPSSYTERRSCSQIMTDEEEDIANGSVVAAPTPPPTAPAASAAKSVRMALAQWFIQALILYMAERQDCVLDAYHSLARPAGTAASSSGGGGASGGNLRSTAASPSPPNPAASTATSFFARFQAAHLTPSTAYKTTSPVGGSARQHPPPVQALPSVTTLLQLLQDCTVDFRRAVVVGGTLNSLRAVSREVRRWQQTAPLATLLARHQQEGGSAPRVAVVETERLTNVVLQICAQVGHGLLEDLREPLQTTSQLCLSAPVRAGGTHADLEVLLRTVQCARAAIHAHQKGAPLSPDAQVALGFLFCRLARAVLQLPGHHGAPAVATTTTTTTAAAAATRNENGGEEAARQHGTPSTYLYAVQTARYLEKAFLTVCGGLDALLHDYRAGCPAFLCEMLSGLCASGASSTHQQEERHSSHDSLSAAAPTTTAISTFDELRRQQGTLWERSYGALDTIEAAALVFYHAAERQRQLRQQQQQQQSASPLQDREADRDMVCELFIPSPELTLYHQLRHQQLQQQQRERERGDEPSWPLTLSTDHTGAAAAAATSATPNFVLLHNVLLGRLPSSGDYEAESSGAIEGGEDTDYKSRENNNYNISSSTYWSETAAMASNSMVAAAARKRNQRREERIVENMVQFTEYMLLFYQKEWLLDRTEVHPIFLLTI